jgi:DNA-binding transcriptional MerR regulator
MRPLTIGTLAKASGVHLETVRYYERIGLMPKPSRTASNYRNYGPEHIERLSFIRRAREIGFSIGEIKELLALAEPGRASCKSKSVVPKYFHFTIHKSRASKTMRELIKNCMERTNKMKRLRSIAINLMNVAADFLSALP